MPAVSLDTSALVKRYVPEVGSAWVCRTLARPTIQVLSTSAIAPPEVLSALQRNVRAGQLTAAEALRRAQRVTTHLTWRYRRLTITPGVLRQTCALVQAYPVRAYDALHLACALAARQRLQQHGAPGRRCVAAATPLLAAAKAEGFLVDHPLLYP
jgi:predicted nucleic acid-binding protein